MAEPTWGQLKKAQDDNTTIDTAIADAIAAHETDPDAHTGAGESLETHKSQEVIDHPAQSIVEDKIEIGSVLADKLSMLEHFIHTVFESLDGWYKSPLGVEEKIGGAAIQTGTTINTVRRLEAQPYGDGAIVDWDKDMMFQEVLKFSATTSQLAYIMTGTSELDGSDNAFGFKIVDNTLYAIHIVGDGESQTEYTTEISGITITNWNVYRAIYDASEGTIKFYVNGILKATHDANIPTQDMPAFFTHYLKNTEGVNKILYLRSLIWAKAQ